MRHWKDCLAGLLGVAGIFGLIHGAAALAVILGGA